MGSESNRSMKWQRSWHVSGTHQACGNIVAEVCQAIESHGHAEVVVFAVRLALEEALANAIRHGHQGDESMQLGVEAAVDAECIDLIVCDEGRGFDPHCVPDPTRDENLMIASGRGLALMRAFMSDVHIDPPGNRIVMRYDIHSPPPQAEGGHTTV